MADEEKLREYLARVIAELQQTRQQLRDIAEPELDPIAIVGMGCRYPGSVASPEDLWQLVDSGQDAISGFPGDRGWDTRLSHGNGYGLDASYAPLGGFLDSPGSFDAALFGVSPREAMAMDPQQRLLLEVTWEALERAGIPPLSLQGSRSGVFIGTSGQDYTALLQQAAAGVDGYLLTGTAASVISGRLAYSFGLEGPAVTIDTACSSSTVAIHLACQALREKECTLAIAGGATVMATPGAFVEFSYQRGLAADGRCKSFAAAADGTGWSEGVGLLVLERLADARRLGHPVLAVVRGSAVNQDGASNGLTAPNGPSQQRVIRQALASARLTPDLVDVVEAHGTGTTLGDPIEAQALLATYGQDRPEGRPLWLGSIKSNIGHTQAAAGVGGVIKMVMAMRHGVLPKTLHVDEPTPHVDWSVGAVSLLTEAREWPASDRPRRAAVSSFGMSGTNTHVILEEPQAAPAANDSVEGLVPVLVSGRNRAALAAVAGRWSRWMATRPDVGAGEVGWSSVMSRSVLEHRAVVLASDRAGLIAGLDRVVAGAGGGPGVVAGVAGQSRRVGVLFSGQGAQRVGMGAGLYGVFPVFTRVFDEVCAGFEGLLPRSLKDVVFADPADRAVDETRYAQAGLFAVEVALFEQLRAWGLRAEVVGGHSIGELVAAYVAGVWSLADACVVVAARGRLMQALPSGGAMLAVAAARDEVAGSLVDGAEIAAVNGPSAVVVSGTAVAVDAVEQYWVAVGVRTTRLRVSHAFHSALMEPMLAEFAEVLAGVTAELPRIGVLSNRAGALADPLQLAMPEYWVEHLRREVRFADGVTALAAHGIDTFVEVGPDAALTPHLHALTADAVIVATLRRDRPEPETLLTALAELHVAGTPIDWTALYPAAHQGADLPTYPFQRTRYWPEPGTLDQTTGPIAVDARFWSAVEREEFTDLVETLRADDAAEESLRVVLPLLSSWRRQQRDSTLIDSWRYRIVWQPAAPTKPATTDLSGRWLVVVAAAWDGTEGMADVVTAMRGAGADVEVLRFSAEDDRTSMTAALTATAVDEPYRGVVSLLAWDEAAIGGTVAVPNGLLANLTLSQALDDAQTPGALWLLTRAAVPAGPYDRTVSPAQAAAWGLGRVVGLESPHRWGGLIDLPATSDGATMSRLCAVLAGDSDEDQVALRTSGVFVRRLVRAESGAQPAARPWSPSATALITGGLGALGRHVGRWLAADGAAHLVLIGRRGTATPGAEEYLAELRGLGARVTVAACDVADLDALTALVDQIEADGERITAVVHTAGLAQTTPLTAVSAGELITVASAKVDGAANLDRIFADRELDAFVVYSSIAGVWGSAGQAAYAAANSYLDALVERRRGAGKAATAIAWGPWASGGMADESATGGDTTEEQLRRRGIPAIDPQLAVAALRQAVEQGDGCVTIADVDWRRFAPMFASTRPRPLLRGVAEAAGAMDASDSGGVEIADEALSLRARLEELDLGSRLEVLTELVRELSAEVLGHSGAADLPGTGTFRDFGFDSLTAVELRNRLSAAVGLRLPTTLVFDHPTPAVTARFVAGQLFGDGPDDRASRTSAGATRGVDEDQIAIVAMSCRYPGMVTSPEDLWRVVDGGLDMMSTFPADRGWDIDRLYDPDPDRAGSFYATAGGFLQDAAGFDAGFFGISPREALAMDPQQRLLLEASWEVVERAGLDPLGLRGSAVGVFVGTNGQDYGALLMGAVDDTGGYAGTGNAASVVSGRVAYVLGLEGPAVSVDTACSSSLVALHLAVQSLRRGECDLALAGGVTVMSTPGLLVEFSRQRGLSVDGRCKAFAEGADGTGWGEGVGVLLVERLSDARRNGHPVLAVVAGSAVNQDGASNGLTAPNGPSQQRVIRQALSDAGLGPSDVDVVEAHGTGTTLGDPIEAQALLATYGQGRPVGLPLLLGSVKSNIGHTQAAAGVAGVIKMVLAMRHGVVPATLHVDVPSSHVDWASGGVVLATQALPWPVSGGVRRAGVSSFGVSGTNAHVILALPEEAPAEEPVGSGVGLVGGVVVWPVSGRSVSAVAAQAGRLAGFVRANPDVGVGRVGWSLVATRSVFERRAAAVGRDRAELLAGLDAIADGTAGVGLAGSGGRLVWVFPGQGSQSAGMAAGLLGSCAVFGDAIAQCQAALAPWVDLDIAGLLSGRDTGWLERVEVVQPVLFAVGVALARVWEAAGGRPHAVIGHSQGEIVAAHVAGLLSLDDAARVVAVRARALRALAGSGAMASIPLTLAETQPLLTDGLVVAAVNGPRSLVVSGPPTQVAALVDGCVQRGVRAKLIPVDYASHGPAVDLVRDQILADLTGIVVQPGHTPMISTVTGKAVDSMTVDYWIDNLRQRVEFDAAVRTAVDDGCRTFVEVSAHPVLTMAITQVLEDVEHDTFVLDTLRRDTDPATRLLTSLAHAHTLGHPIDYTTILTPTPTLNLPTYPFQHQRFWPQPNRNPLYDMGAAGLHESNHPLLGAAVRIADEDGLVMTGRLSAGTQPWLADHRVGGAVILAGTALLDLVLSAGDQLDAGRVVELTLAVPVVLPPGGALRLQVRIGAPDDAGLRPVTVHSQPDGPLDAPWTRHADGLLAPAAPSTPDTGPDQEWPPSGAASVEFDRDEWYRTMADRGLEYGPAFQGLDRVWRRGDEVFAEVELPAPDAGAEQFGLHPALLDAALQATAFGDFFGGPDGGAPSWMPFAWSEVNLYAQGAVRLRVRLAPAGDDAVGVTVEDDHGGLVASVASLAFRPAADVQASVVSTDSLYQIDWVETPAPTKGALRRWAVLGEDHAGFATAVTRGGETVSQHRDLAELVAAVAGGQPAPDVVLAHIGQAAPADALIAAAHLSTTETAGLLQLWLGESALNTAQLVLHTLGAIGADSTEAVPHLGAAPVWGLVRSAQSEHPGRFVLVDTDGADTSVEAVAAALHGGEPQLASRRGAVLVPRLVRAGRHGAVALPDGSVDAPPPPWRLDVGAQNSLDDLVVRPAPEAAAPLTATQVRVELRASGVNLRDVVLTLGMVPDQQVLGNEGAGLVVEVGADVTGFAPGDAVLGIFSGSFASTAVTEARLLAHKPDGWSFIQAATVPVAFLTAYYGLVDVTGVQPGESVLIHSAAGGVGLAAVQLGRHLGARLFGTASPGKWPALRAAGLADPALASSRTLDFETSFRERTGGRGVDVVLNGLTGGFVDASLRLLADGGRFVELGKTDKRQPDEVGREHPGVRYQAFDLIEAGYDRIGEMLTELMALFERGVLQPLPVRGWDLRQAPEAFRFLSQARQIGKVAVTIPRPLDPYGTVLIAGGTGTLGAQIARHLVLRHGVRRLLLASRHGLDADGATDLAAELKAAGCEVTVVATDLGDEAGVAELLTAVDPGAPLTAVVVATGVLDDAVIESLTPERIDAVLRAKVDVAWRLHHATRELDLSTFVMFSAAAGVLGGPGQGNYAAANTFLDALAHDRRAAGLPATSLAWGRWEQASGMTGHLATEDVRRLARAGMAAFTTAEALDLFDLSLRSGRPTLVPARLAVRPGPDPVHPMLSSLFRSARRMVATGSADAAAGGLRTRLEAMIAEQRGPAVLTVVCAHVAVVLGHSDPGGIDPGRAFRELGFDSLTAVELRNRLGAATGLRLAATVVFDHPTPSVLAEHVLAQLVTAAPSAEQRTVSQLDQLEAALSGLDPGADGFASVTERLQALLSRLNDRRADGADDDLDRATADTIFDLIDRELETP